MNAVLALNAQAAIAEAPLWDEAGNRLLWVDHKLGSVHEVKADGAGGWRESRHWNLGGHVAAAIPRTGGGLLVVGGTEGVFLSESGGVELFVRFGFDPARIRCNEAKCDSRGRLWVGTLATDFKADAGLYRVEGNGTITRVLDRATIANGMDWSPEDTTFYFVDSCALTIDAFDFNPDQGEIANRRTLVALKPGEGAANGLSVDREGFIWVALTGAGHVRRYSPAGEWVATVDLSAKGATSCGFGGPDGADLFITSRSGVLPEVVLRMGMSEAMRDVSGPGAGGIFVCRPGVTGAPARLFQG